MQKNTPQSDAPAASAKPISTMTGPRFPIQDGPTIYLLAAKHHHPHWSWMQCHRSLQRYLERADCPFHGMWNLPSPGSVYRLMRMLPGQIRTLMPETSERHWLDDGFSRRDRVDGLHPIVVGDTQGKAWPTTSAKPSKGKMKIPGKKPSSAGTSSKPSQNNP